MKILVTSDIHGIAPWYDHILNEAHGCDLTMIAGDVIDINDDGLDDLLKPEVFLRFIERMEQADNPLVFTSGNHDMDDLPVSPLGGGGAWMAGWAFNDHSIIESYNRVISYQSAVVMSLRWLSWGDVPDGTIKHYNDLASKARERADIEGKPLIVMFHEPPQSHQVMTQLISRFRPEYFICGHDHEGPLWCGPISSIEDTLVINTGQNMDSATPAFGTLDISKQTFEWCINKGNGAETKIFDLNSFRRKQEA